MRSLPRVQQKVGPDDRFPLTISVLKTAFSVERKAAETYDGYCRRAVEESFPNIAASLEHLDNKQ